MKKTRPLISLYFLLFGLIPLALITRAISLFTPEIWIDEGTVGVMGLHAGQGEFPLFFYGQKFMGAVEAYLYGLFFHILDPSPFTLELLPALLSILFILLTYLLAKKIFDRKTALISGLFLALPPYFLMFWTHEARLHYSLVLLFGSLILLITQKILQQKYSLGNKPVALFMLLGLIGGIGWWTNYLIIVYLLTAVSAFGLLNSKAVISKNAFVAVFFFLIGSLPLWSFNFIHHSSILGIWGSTQFSFSGLFLKIKAFFTNALPIILGSFRPFSSNKVELAGYLLVGVIHLGAFFCLIVHVWRRFAFTSSPGKTKGAELLLFLLLLTILVDLFSGYGHWLNEPCQRYLLPLYSVLPIMLGFFVSEIQSRSRISSCLLIGLILFFNLLGNLNHTSHFFRWKDAQPIYNGWKLFDPQALNRFRDSQQREDRLMSFLESKGHRTIYAEEALRKKLTFQSKESLIFSDPYQEIYLKYADLVDGSENPVYLFNRENKTFEENLKALGGTYQKLKTEDGFFIYGEFHPPRQCGRMLPRFSWRGIPSRDPSRVNKAFDGDVGTGWRSEQSPEPGNTFMLDLGRMETIYKLSWIPDNYREVPLGFQIDLSSDGRIWQTVTRIPHYWGPIFWSGPHPMIKIRNGRIESIFPSVQARYLRITLTGKDPNRDWSINELFLFSPDKGGDCLYLKEKDLTELIHFLKTHHLDFIYADHWLSAVIRSKSNWEIHTLISNHYLDNNGERMPRPGLFSPVRVNSGTGFLVDQASRDFFEETLQALHLPYQSKGFGPLTLYFGMANSDKAVEQLEHYYWSGTLLLKRGGQT